MESETTTTNETTTQTSAPAMDAMPNTQETIRKATRQPAVKKPAVKKPAVKKPAVKEEGKGERAILHLQFVPFARDKFTPSYIAKTLIAASEAKNVDKKSMGDFRTIALVIPMGRNKEMLVNVKWAMHILSNKKIETFDVSAPDCAKILKALGMEITRNSSRIKKAKAAQA